MGSVVNSTLTKLFDIKKKYILIFWSKKEDAIQCEVYNLEKLDEFHSVVCVVISTLKTKFWMTDAQTKFKTKEK